MNTHVIQMVSADDIANGLKVGDPVWFVRGQPDGTGIFALSEDADPEVVVLNMEQVREETHSPVLLSGTETAHAAAVLSVPLEQNIPRVNPKDLVGQSKVDMSLVPTSAIVVEAHAMMDGARKYGAYNWRENPVLMRVYLSAALRHIGKFLDGEDFDEDSGVHHLGHGRACLGIVYDAITVGNVIDDRPLPAPTSALMKSINMKNLESQQ